MSTIDNEAAIAEIRAFITRLNACWTFGNPDDLALFFHPEMIAITPVDRDRRIGAAACIAGWKGFAQAATIHRWQENDFVIRCFGHTAVVSYFYEIEFEMNGKRVSETGRDLFTLVFDQGRWQAVADQYSAFPS